MKRLTAFMRRYRKIIYATLGLGLLVLGGILWTLIFAYEDQIYYQADEIPQRSVALVFGAGYSAKDGSLSRILQDRMDAAIELYRAGRVKKLVLSGDNSTVTHDEPGRMKDYALSKGIPEEDIVLDYAGRRTYDTCYRAGAIFQLKDAILVTQRYHQPRALLTCKSLGLDVVGFASDRQYYSRRYIAWYWIREAPALVRTWLDLNIAHPLPILGEPLPVFTETQTVPNS